MKALAQKPRPDHSQVVVFPPVIPLAGFLLGLGLERLIPLGPWIAGALRTGGRGVGVLLLVIGIAGFAWMVATMKRARTPIHNARTPTTLVRSGPFRFTRNPMYLFGSVGYAGLALVLVQPWSLMLLLPVWTATHLGVVLREEAFLERRFGDEYRQFKERVPRYL